MLTLGFGNRWQYPPSGLDRHDARAAGPRARTCTRPAARRARRRRSTDPRAGDPVIAYVDQQVIGTWGQPEALSGICGYPVVIADATGRRRYQVDDRGRAPLLVDAGRDGRRPRPDRLVQAPARPVHRPAAGLIPADRLRTAVRAGLDDQVEHLRRPSDSFSLPAWRKWARLLTDERNAKAWPRVFADGAGLFGTLISIVEGVDDGVGATGGHLRELYAMTLDEAAVILDRPALSDAAAAWRAVADLWEDLADAAVADLAARRPRGDRGRGAAPRRRHGGRAGEVPRQAAAEKGRSGDRYADAFPLPPDHVAAILEDLGDQLRADPPG